MTPPAQPTPALLAFFVRRLPGASEAQLRAMLQLTKSLGQPDYARAVLAELARRGVALC
jgi:hypothetical protein